MNFEHNCIHNTTSFTEIYTIIWSKFMKVGAVDLYGGGAHYENNARNKPYVSSELGSSLKK